MASKKSEPADDGVALSISDTPDRYAESGVSVAVPEDASTEPAKPARKAAARKRTVKKAVKKAAATPTGQSAESTEES